MADSRLNKTGLNYFWSRIKTIFATKTELGALSDRVDDIVSEGGEPNLINSISVNGTTQTITNKNVDITVPTDTSDLTNDGDGTSPFATQAYVGTNGGKIDVIKVNGTTQTITDKSVDITVPTQTSQLTNNSDFQTSSDVSSAISSAISGITSFEYQIVASLPASGVKGVVYLVSNGGSGSNIYDEYIWVTSTSTFEKIGTTDVDLTGYWNESNLTAITTAEIDTIVAS